MKLDKIAVVPELLTIIIDDEDIIKEYGEPLEFKTFDRQPLDVFMKLASADHTNPASMIDSIRPMILDDNGQPLIKGNIMLPTNVMIKVISKLVEQMGNLSGQM
jgi:hypothetical protein